jgi:hypothetical protein
VEPSLVAGLLGQHTASGLPELTTGAWAVNLTTGGSVALPALAQITEISAAGQGWSVMLVVRGHRRARAGDVLVDTHSLGFDGAGAGLRLAVPESQPPK